MVVRTFLNVVDGAVIFVVCVRVKLGRGSALKILETGGRC